MRKINQQFVVEFQYPVYFTTDLFSETNPVLADTLQRKRNKNIQHKVLFVVDKGVSDHHPHLKSAIQKYFQGREGFVWIEEFIVIPGGEQAKNSGTHVHSLIEAIDRHGIDRHSYICIIGGGAVLDMACYTSSIGHRGIRHIRIPTTVLSQNDSGVGVKNGINFGGKKNFIGTFVPPFAVLNDRTFLSTLDQRNWLSGISEAIKVALIKDYAFFEKIEKDALKLRERSADEMEDLIYRCAELHLEHIRSGDPFESGSSRPLDFGHWSAHKLEQLTNFEVLHGEAVAIGIALDVVYSHKIGNLKIEEVQRVLNLFLNLDLPIDHPFLTTNRNNNPLLLGLDEFREHLGGELCITLLEKMGVGKEYNVINEEVLMDSIAFLKNYKREA